MIKRFIDWEYYDQEQKFKEVIILRKNNISLSEFTKEEGFELNGYISQLFEQASTEDNKEKS